MKQPQPICLLGPTASGKTDAACRLVDELNGEIISVDSAMIYRGMDIGTATPDKADLKRYPHHLINLIDPAERYSVASFIHDCQAAIKQIRDRGKRPILVGGTMMYFYCLQNGLSSMPAIDSSIEEVLHQRLSDEGVLSLHAELRQVDPALADKIRPTDQQRILRALAVYHATGEPLSKWQQEVAAPALSQVINIVLAPADRQVLHQRIARRFDIMLQQGFMAEVEALYQRGDLHLNCPSIRCVGYRQAWQYLAGDIDHAQMKERAVIATRQLAKRQLTWLRRQWADARWCDTQQPDYFEQILAGLQNKD